MRRFRAAGIDLNFFFPKWSPRGYSLEEGSANTASAGWQAYLHSSPVPGGWSTLVQLASEIHDLDCLVQGFICPVVQDEGGPEYDADRASTSGLGIRQATPLSMYDAVDRNDRVLDSLEREGLQLDVFYYDCYSAHWDFPQDFSVAHPLTRRQNIEAMSASFKEARRRGIMPGAEVARFWAIPDCDYFFYTDWSKDRQSGQVNTESSAPAGTPIPLFQLVFHDCFMAGFPGGGYAAYHPGMDWWEEYNPRLYELMNASAPAYNWLPDPTTPIIDFDGEREQRKRQWLKLWSTYYQAIAFSEMVSHQIGPDSKRLLAFANGVTGEFDLAENRFKVSGVPELGEDWQQPPEL